MFFLCLVYSTDCNSHTHSENALCIRRHPDCSTFRCSSNADGCAETSTPTPFHIHFRENIAFAGKWQRQKWANEKHKKFEREQNSENKAFHVIGPSVTFFWWNISMPSTQCGWTTITAAPYRFDQTRTPTQAGALSTKITDRRSLLWKVWSQKCCSPSSKDSVVCGTKRFEAFNAKCNTFDLQWERQSKC